MIDKIMIRRKTEIISATTWTIS